MSQVDVDELDRKHAAPMLRDDEGGLSEDAQAIIDAYPAIAAELRAARSERDAALARVEGLKREMRTLMSDRDRDDAAKEADRGT